MNYDTDEDLDYGITAEPEVAIQINRELNLARRIVEETGSNLFLTGKAGTGKTTFLHRLRRDSRKRMVVLAPTGVAAINAGGMTIHSFFQLPFSPFIPGQGFLGEEKRFFRFSREKRRLIASIDLIVIDEISMVRPDTLDAIDSMLRRFRDPQLPFGGVQLLLIGDLRQLAPVVRPDEWEYLRPHYASPYFFESVALREAGFVTVELLTIYRQQDSDFISLLNAVRDGNAGPDVLGRLNALCAPGKESDDDKAIRLTTHNHISDRINETRLSALPTAEQTFYADVSGKFPESSYPADERLRLKNGARVMFIKNDTGAERRYYNGMIGTVTAIGDDTVTVMPDDGREEIETGYVEWENTVYEIDPDTKEITSRREGAFSQIPLRLAWAITIHKSQGLTFDRAVIDASRSFAPGQLYVALSRCRSLEGLRLETPLPPSAVIIDKDVNSFIDRSKAAAPDESTLAMLRDEYFRRLLRELFDFGPLSRIFSDFTRNVLEYVAPIHPELFDRYRDAEKRMKERIAAVGNRFADLYASRRLDSDAVGADERFIEKISGGCRYFLEELVPISQLCNETPLMLDNALYEQRLAKAADALEFEINIKRYILRGLAQEHFSTRSYMKFKALAVLDFEEGGHAGGNTPEKKRKMPKERKPKRPKGYSERETLKLFREGKTIEQIMEERNLALSTIVGHLVKMSIAGELPLTDLIDPGEAERLKKLYEESGATDLRTFKEKVPTETDGTKLYVFYEAVICKKLL